LQQQFAEGRGIDIHGREEKERSREGGRVGGRVVKEKKRNRDQNEDKHRKLEKMTGRKGGREGGRETLIKREKKNNGGTKLPDTPTHLAFVPLIQKCIPFFFPHSLLSLLVLL